MGSDKNQSRSKSFQQKQYTALRNEVSTRIQMRRRLLAAGLAFIAAFSGLIFSTSSSSQNNYWLLAILPPIIVFLMVEIFRSEMMLKKAAYFIQDIEEELLEDVEKFGWEHRYGGYSDPKNVISLVPAVFLMLTYFVSVSLTGLFWGSQPEQLQWIPTCGLLGVYILALIAPSVLFIKIRDISKDNYK